MKHIQRAIALSGLLVLLTFSSALGQTDRQTIIHIPFNFSVGEKSFSAGKYVIERNRRDSDTVWVIRHKDNSGKAVLLTRPVRANRHPGETKTGLQPLRRPLLPVWVLDCRKQHRTRDSDLR